MAALWLAVSAIQAVFLIVLVIRFLTRNRWPDAADSGSDHVLSVESTLLQGKNGDTAPPSSYSLDAAEIVHKTEEPSSSLHQVLAEPGHEFEVFLSFRGQDTRQKFTDCLYHVLIGVGVHVFKDNEELHVGKEISPDLMCAIEQSQISIPIFSKGYASSKWCLREVSQMVRCMKETGGKHMIMPIFLDVTPGVVRHQTGAYAEPFARHERKYGSETVKEWRDALQEITKLKGLELNKAASGNEGEFIQLVVAKVLKELRQARLDVDEVLVGLDDPADELMHLLDVDIKDIRMVGIWGTGGIGKTTQAKYVYNQIVDNFECCSFLQDIRETCLTPRGLLELQSKLIADILGHHKYHVTSIDDGIDVLKKRIRGKKVLIVLDDVDHICQLKALAGDLSWFGLGSRILVTTREKGVLLKLQRCSIHEVQPLEEDRALELFCKHAFRCDSPPTNFVNLSRKIVKITGGLPLALEVIGSFLFVSREQKGVWEDTIKQLERGPPADVQHKLRISFDALTYEEKEIFLDIACFFIGADYELVTPMWDDCKFFPKLGIEVLRLKSLIKIGDDNRLIMHDQLRDLGRHIVEQENYKEPELRSRLWRKEEAIDVIRGHQGTPKIEAATIWAEKGVTYSAKCFQNLRKLRILLLYDGVQLDGSFQHLLPELRLLRWSTMNIVSLPTVLPLNNLVVLCLSSSPVDEDWIGWNSKMWKLKVLDLSYCKKLTRAPDFSTFPNLERLTLESCLNLISAGPSIQVLTNLSFLNLKNCKNLKKLPTELGNLKSLVVLIVDSTKVKEIPISTWMKELEFLSANDCFHLKSIPESIGSLVSLRMLSLRHCRSLWGLPDNIGQLNSLVEMQLQDSGVAMKEQEDEEHLFSSSSIQLRAQ